MMEKRFIKATAKYSSLNRHIPAPYIRKSFELPFVPDRATVKVCGLGFYLLYVNGKEITKGYLAPYISNPDDYCYYDTYDLLPYLKKGKKAFDGEIWLLYLAGYGIGRAIIEYIRTDQLYITGTTIPVSMVLGIVMAVVCIGLDILVRKRKIQTLQTEMSEEEKRGEEP